MSRRKREKVKIPCYRRLEREGRDFFDEYDQIAPNYELAQSWASEFRLEGLLAKVEPVPSGFRILIGPERVRPARACELYLD